MKKCFLLLFMGSILLFSSCLVSKKVVYVEDMLPDTTYSVMDAPTLRIQKNDRLNILVSSKMPELAAPFNQGIGAYQLDDEGDIVTNSSVSNENKGYLVDNQGAIDFPILGTLYVKGMAIDDVKNLIKVRLIDEKLISDPVIKIELLNLKINMMGEVNSVGVLDVSDGRITLLEAITRSGGLTINAATDRIKVIREENGERKVIISDIQSYDIFNSPGYYLQQNDIVYVEPRDAEMTPRVEENWRYFGTGIGLLGTVFTILNFLK